NAGVDRAEEAGRRRIGAGVRAAVRIGSAGAPAPALREAPVGMGPLRLPLPFGLIPLERAGDDVHASPVEVELQLVAVELAKADVVVREEVEFRAGEIGPLLVEQLRAAERVPHRDGVRSEEHTSELQ